MGLKHCILKPRKIHTDRLLKTAINEETTIGSTTLCTQARLPRTSTSSPSWIFEALVPVPRVVGGGGSEQTSWIQSRTLRTETRNLEIPGRQGWRRLVEAYTKVDPLENCPRFTPSYKTILHDSGAINVEWKFQRKWYTSINIYEYYM